MVNTSEVQSLLQGLLDPNVSKTISRNRTLLRARSDPLLKHSDHAVDYLQSPQSNSTIPNFKPNLPTIIVFLISFISIGTLYFYFASPKIKGGKTNAIVDSLYFSIVTMTTVGYGDLVPASSQTKVGACVFCFAGVAFVGLLLSEAADYLVEKQEMLIFEVLHLRDKASHYDLMKKMESCKVKYKFYVSVAIFLVLVVAGILFLVLVEDFTFVDAFYCVLSTVTTLGYGDVSFSTTNGRLFASFWILACTLSLGQLLFGLTQVLTERKQKELVNRVLRRKMTVKDLEIADIDNSGDVGASEFVLFKLKEMGRIKPDDVALLLHEFECLDVDQSGTLSPTDLALMQS